MEMLCQNLSMAAPSTPKGVLVGAQSPRCEGDTSQASPETLVKGSTLKDALVGAQSPTRKGDTSQASPETPAKGSTPKDALVGAQSPRRKGDISQASPETPVKGSTPSGLAPITVPPQSPKHQGSPNAGSPEGTSKAGSPEGPPKVGSPEGTCKAGSPEGPPKVGSPEGTPNVNVKASSPEGTPEAAQKEPLKQHRRTPKARLRMTKERVDRYSGHGVVSGIVRDQGQRYLNSMEECQAGVYNAQVDTTKQTDAFAEGDRVWYRVGSDTKQYTIVRKTSAKKAKKGFGTFYDIAPVGRGRYNVIERVPAEKLSRSKADCKRRLLQRHAQRIENTKRFMKATN